MSNTDSPCKPETGLSNAVTRQANIVHLSPQMKDLAPGILRQRMVLEGTCPVPISQEKIIDYLGELSNVCEMRLLRFPVTHRSDRFGWAGWIHWETSGAHFYAWETPQLFFSVDIYTCKAFDAERVYWFTKDFFEAQEMAAASF